MLPYIKLSGSYFSTKRRQINQINYYVEKINRYCSFKPEKANPQKAIEYADKLAKYYQKLLQEKNTSSSAALWFANNPVDEIKKMADIRQLCAQAQLASIYDHYNGKESFRNLIQEKLEQVEAPHKVVPLETANNNPIVLIEHETMSFVIRFLRMNVDEEISENSPRFVRARCHGIPQIPQPYLEEWVADDGREITFLEYSKYYAGNLQQYFNPLRSKKEMQQITEADFQQEILLFAKKLAEFFIIINQRDIWYTDLKPTNILLTENKEIVISDIKGLIASQGPMIQSNRASSSPHYYQTSVFHKEQLNLEALQCQTLAVTLYQLACNKLPTRQEKKNGAWSNVYDFEQEVFQGDMGDFFQDLIMLLNTKVPIPMASALRRIEEQLWLIENSADEVSLDDPMLVEMPPPRNNGNHYRKL